MPNEESRFWAHTSIVRYFNFDKIKLELHVLFLHLLLLSNRPFVTLRELASLKHGSNMFDVKSISDYLDDEELWQLSMTHSSANGVTGKNHERLEFLGDRFLELVF